MPDPTGFLRYDRRLPARRPVPLRLLDWAEVYPPAGDELIREQATRCMDCGIPFCTSDTAGCPLANRIPDWNDLVRTGNWDFAIESLHATNNFPEFTGKLCPAPCEAACVLGINGGASVTIKQVEAEIAHRAWERGTVVPRPAPEASGRRVAVVGSGPAGLAAAQQLARAGHAVTVFERDDLPGGLLRYGIPDFKLEKVSVDRRIGQLEAEGVRFVTGVAVGTDITTAQLRAEHDAVLLACGALAGRDMPGTPGRELRGVHLAMEHLVPANRHVAGRVPANRHVAGRVPANRHVAGRVPANRHVAGRIAEPEVTAAGKHVVIIGGGDTAADCLGVAHRQGAASVTQLDLYPLPPDARDEGRDPWPTWPWILRSYPAHEEGGERVFSVAVQEFVDGGSGEVKGIRIAEVTVEKSDGQRIVNVVAGTERELPADLVLLAIGFEGTEEGPLLDQLGLTRARSGGIACGPDWQTPAEGFFVAGDMHRGASLIVWAIAEGRAAAAAIHQYLDGKGTLPAPVHADSRPLAVR